MKILKILEKELIKKDSKIKSLKREIDYLKKERKIPQLDLNTEKELANIKVSYNYEKQKNKELKEENERLIAQIKLLTSRNNLNEII